MMAFFMNFKMFGERLPLPLPTLETRNLKESLNLPLTEKGICSFKKFSYYSLATKLLLLIHNISYQNADILDSKNS